MTPEEQIKAIAESCCNTIFNVENEWPESCRTSRISSWSKAILPIITESRQPLQKELDEAKLSIEAWKGTVEIVKGEGEQIEAERNQLKQQLAEVVKDKEHFAAWLIGEALAMHGCLTGDCPHQKQDDCIIAILNHYKDYRTAISATMNNLTK